MRRSHRFVLVLLACVSGVLVLGLLLQLGIVFSEFRGRGASYVQQIALCALLALRVCASLVLLVPRAWRGGAVGLASMLMAGAVGAIAALAWCSSWEWRPLTLALALVATFLTVAGWLAGWRVAAAERVA